MFVLISLLPDTGAALASAVPGLEISTTGFRKESEIRVTLQNTQNLRMNLKQNKTTTKPPNGFQALLLHILYAAFGDREKEILFPSCLLRLCG